jgi:HlyD family secretion protein
MTPSRKLAAAAALVIAAGVAVTWTVQRPQGEDSAINVTGTIEGLQVDVSAKISGRIAELPVKQGDRVQRTQLLVRIESRDLAAELSRSEAAARAAEATLRDLQAGSRPEEIQEAEARAARARAQLDDLLAGSRAQELEQARAAVRNAMATRQWTEKDFQRVLELFGRELVAAQEVDRARQAYEVAAANEQSARERLSLLEAGPREHEVQAARHDVQAALERVRLLRAGPRANAVDAARAQAAEARAAVLLARARLAETEIFSPLTGVVLRKNMEAGETATPGVSILTLLDPTDIWLRAYVPETEVGRLRVGQPAAISVDAYPHREFAGTITEISSEAEFTPKNVQTKKERVTLVFRLRIAVRNVDGILKPGLPADARIPTRS